jgi:hypothetical protein
MSCESLFFILDISGRPCCSYVGTKGIPRPETSLDVVAGIDNILYGFMAVKLCRSSVRLQLHPVEHSLLVRRSE